MGEAVGPFAQQGLDEALALSVGALQVTKGLTKVSVLRILLALTLATILSTCTFKNSDEMQKEREDQKGRAREVFSALYKTYGNERKYTFGLRQPQGQDFTHQVFKYVNDMGAVYLEDGTPEFSFTVTLDTTHTYSDNYRLTARVALVDSRKVSGGGTIVHMSSLGYVNCRGERRRCTDNAGAAVTSALYGLSD